MIVSSASAFNLRSMTTTSIVDLHRIFSTIGLYEPNRTAAGSTLNDTAIDGGGGGGGSGNGDPFGSNTSSSSSSSAAAAAAGKDIDDGSGEAATSMTTATSMRFVFRWYALIAILSVLVVTGIVFAVCRLSIKAEAYRKSGIGTHQDGLLFSEYSRTADLPGGPLDVDGSNDL